MYERLYKASAKWYNIGIYLKVSIDTLKSIEKEYRGIPEECLREMLIKCLQTTKPLTWRDVYVCLISPTVQREDIAEEIEKWIQGKYHNEVHAYGCVVIYWFTEITAPVVSLEQRRKRSHSLPISYFMGSFSNQPPTSKRSLIGKVTPHSCITIIL